MSREERYLYDLDFWDDDYPPPETPGEEPVEEMDLDAYYHSFYGY
ncbi:MAG: hypothetical protein ACOY81_06990 [Bacillota bacterium]|nr:hypothetical protein [Desulfurispora thermophila]